MIKNERQRRIAASKLTQLEEARASFPGEDKNSWSAYTNLIDDILAEIDDFDRVANGLETDFPVECLDAVGDALIKARISRKLTQSGMADHLGVAEQQVQRDEAKGYENAGLSRVAEVIDVLGYELKGVLRRKDTTWEPTVAIGRGDSFSSTVEVAPASIESKSSSNPTIAITGFKRAHEKTRILGERQVSGAS